MTDLPDYTKKVVLDQTVPPSTLAQVDHRKILGDDLGAPTVSGAIPISIENPAIKNATATPTVAASVPVSVENSALAFDSVNNEFYIRSQNAARPVYVDLRSILGTALVGRDWSGDFAKLQNIPTDPAKESGKLTDIAAYLLDLTEAATPFYVQATASGNSTVITPTAGKKVRIKAIMVLNSGAATITVYLRFAAGGSARFQGALAANSGWNFNLIGCHWEGAVDELFIVNLSGTGTVDVSGMYEEL